MNPAWAQIVDVCVSSVLTCVVFAIAVVFVVVVNVVVFAVIVKKLLRRKVSFDVNLP